MKIIIMSSKVAELLPLLLFHMDPDMEVDTECLPAAFRKILGGYVLKCLSGKVETTTDVENTSKLMSDPILKLIPVKIILEIEVVDTDGTMLITTEK